MAVVSIDREYEIQPTCQRQARFSFVSRTLVRPRKAINPTARGNSPATRNGIENTMNTTFIGSTGFRQAPTRNEKMPPYYARLNGKAIRGTIQRSGDCEVAA